MRFLALELDGRSTLDRTQQRLYGVVIGQLALAHARPGATRIGARAYGPASRTSLRRWLRSTVEGLRRPR